MSASEKLRALDGKFKGLRVGDTPPPVLELTFWPQIVEVVGAAESVTSADQSAWHGSRLLLSLAALDEALGA